MKQIFLLLSALIIITSCNSEKKQVEVIKNKHADWVYDATIYEVNIRQYTPEGTFTAFSKHIPRLSELGVDILWFMPVQPIGKKERKGTLGSYYSIQNYIQTNPDFGNMDDFKQIVDEAHKAGMKVILDWVANHTSHDAEWITQHRDWYVTDSLGKIVSPYDWTDVAKLNYDNPDMREAMKQAMIFWIKETGIDGFRCDVAYEVPTDFWENTIQAIKEVKADIFMLAEAEKPELNQTAFDAYYNWEVHHQMNDIAQGKANVDSLRLALKKMSDFPEYAIPMNFTSNHDENSWQGTEFERMGNAARTFAALTYLLPGIPLIYSGQETGFDRRLAFFEKDSINWNNLQEFTSFYQSMNQLRKNNSALYSPEKGGIIEEIKTDLPQKTFAFKRQTTDNSVVAIFNLSKDSVQVSLINEDLNNKQPIVLSGWEYRIY